MDIINWLLNGDSEEPGILQKIEYAIKNSGIETGSYGEWLTEYMLGNNNLKGYSKSLHNIYLPYRGRTSEIDVLLVHNKGIFVIESKNYSGWIFGSPQQSYWTQCLPNKQKYRFYNPIMQNRTHINALSQYTGINKSKMKSFIVFSERCELKKVPEDTKEYTILQRDMLLDSLRMELSERQELFSDEQVDIIINKVKPLTEVTDGTKEKHIENIKNNMR